VSARPATNEAALAVRKGPLVGPVLGRVVGMLAARAQCPIDRLDDAMLLTDAVAAHAPAHTADGHVRVTVAAGDGAIELRVRALSRDGANGLLADADLPGVGNVFQRVADDVDARSAEGDGHGELVLRLRFAAA
jgi:hypothetical protein